MTLEKESKVEHDRNRDRVEAVATMTPLQLGILFHSLQAREHDPYFRHVVLSLQGRLDMPALNAAWQAVVARHQGLRATYRWEETMTPLQVILDWRPAPISVVDWTAAHEGERKNRLAKLVADELTRGYDFRGPSAGGLSLIRFSAEHHWLVWSHHHIALDGWSTSVVLAELLTEYGRATSGSPKAMPPFARHDALTRYVAWLHEKDMEEAKAYWERLLSGFEAATPLPRSKASRTEGHAERVFQLSAAESDALRAAARAAEVTVNTLVQGAWCLVLGRRALVEDVVVGVTMSGRPPEQPWAEDGVGLFINTVPLRVRLDEKALLRAWLRGVQEQGSVSRQHEHTPLAEIRKAARRSARDPLFDSILVFDSFPIAAAREGETHDLQIEWVSTPGFWQACGIARGLNNYPLSLIVTPQQCLTFSLAYRCDGFDECRIDELSVELLNCLRDMSQKRDLVLGDIGRPSRRATPPLPPREEGVATASEPSEAGRRETFLEVFARQVRRNPNAVAARAESETATYAELDARSTLLARSLLQRGVLPEDRVAVHGGRSLEFLVAILGVMKAGAMYVPLDQGLPSARAAELVRESRAAFVLLENTADTPAFDVVTLSIRALVNEAAQPDVASPALHPHQAAYLIFTSGSTGTPKGVVVSHGALAGYLEGIRRCLFDVACGDMAMVSTVSADLGHTTLFGALYLGEAIHLVAHERVHDADRLADYMHTYQIANLKIVPSHLRALLHAEHPEWALPTRVLVLGGEASDWALVQEIRRLRPGLRIFNHYGPTEATVGASAYELPANGEGATVPMGSALPGAALYVLDRDLDPVGTEEDAELYIGGERLARGYWNAPRMTAERFLPDPFSELPGQRMYRTGDRVRRGADDRLRYLGRWDRQVKVRGYRVDLGEVEFRLASHPAVREVAVVTEGAAGGLQLVAYVVSRDSVEALSESLREHLTRLLPDYMVPSRIMLIERMPLTKNGKLDREALSQRAPSPQTAPMGPLTAAEEVLVELWQQVLKLERVGMTDNFFELGGDSILCLQLIARARRRGWLFAPQQLVERPTIRALAAVLRQRHSHDADRTQATPEGRVELTPIQARFFAQGRVRPDHYNMAVSLRSARRMSEGYLQLALCALVEHHDALRLRFRRDASGDWTQAYADLGAERERWQSDPLLKVVQVDDLEADLALREAHARLSLADGPLMRGVLLRTERGDERLVLIVHHLVVDGVSWRILLEDLEAVYRALLDEGPNPLLRKTASFQRWSQCLVEYAHTESARQELDYWARVGSAPHRAIVRDNPEGKNTVRYHRSSQWVIGPRRTETLLRHAPRHYGADAAELLLAMVTRAVCKWADIDSLLVELEGHGREPLFGDLDVTRTVGWFTTRYPVRVDPRLSAGATLRQSIEAVAAQARAVPRKGIGYGVLAYLGDESRREPLRGALRPEVTFNYLGQLDATASSDRLLDLAAGDAGPGQDAEETLDFLLNIGGQVLRGELCLWIQYSCDVFTADRIARLVRTCERELEGLLAPFDGTDTARPA